MKFYVTERIGPKQTHAGAWFLERSATPGLVVLAA